MREAVRRIRMLWLLNAPLCRLIRLAFRLAGRRVPEAVSSHLPKVGRVRVDVPGGRPVVLWSRGDDWVANRLFWYGFDGYEPESTRPFLALARGCEAVYDIGAHVGYFSLLAASVEPAAHVIAFEPLPQVYVRLRRNLALNPAADVEHRAVAAGARPGRAPFFHTDQGVPSSSSLDGEFMASTASLTSSEVEVVAIDDVAAADGRRVGLVKIDTESTEPDVLAGMARVLDEHRPVVLCEVLAGLGVEARLHEVLAPHRYCIWHLRTDGLVRADVIVADEEQRNWLFVPEERDPQIADLARLASNPSPAGES